MVKCMNLYSEVKNNLVKTELSTLEYCSIKATICQRVTYDYQSFRSGHRISNVYNDCETINGSRILT